MTGPDCTDTIGLASSKGRHKQNLARQVLEPLRSGTPVVLSVDDPRLPKKKRVTQALIFFTPLTVYGRLSSKILVSMPGYGSEIVDTKLLPITGFELSRLGLGYGLSKALATELTLVFTSGENDEH